ncbi:HAUS augmin-like complex subunit 1 [Amphibalanus amphitrite]|uniref:HAUS augmin-like complex subunit 1 n=1 Tax=Amphibalanus amphitrite TaxID=1232801 RepID=A0A6A4V924_AMPAM|nr:HAUS augmin-like complex subunit 1 [Amphibalanus amphitrite]XP_043227462.1 HAUS augmin-like complex subunit 1 [Amphibalanus amphitrite]XP_043227463.1 HAUS augmin-like complex subunit 1 [Amphibalanus amphitrite]XP_043227464.1 HAUS augmin-like complex subunit 1 [Amphibalanus amphitrite]XP_043227465.1 HAUS augmin-like complex subunit 1 [Amphibalanus amphitrite]XP_043227467.1 HAUS augmin-like complex subunit 1 [Amphibalanus amphitrite]XP_043227468.1 HAUS augmin-like complex subunit 1 [Amphibal
MNKEIVKINQWLVDTLGTADVPAYEVDRRTLSLLQQLQATVDANDEHARRLTEHLRVTRAAYAAEQRRLEAAQRRLGVERVHLASDSQRVLSALAHSAQLLGLDRPSPAGLLLEHARLEREQQALAARLEREQAGLRGQQADVKQLLVQEAALERQLTEAAAQQGADEAVIQQKLAKSRFLSGKMQEYKSLVRKQEGILAQRGFSEELTHDMILRRFEFLTQKRGSLEQLQLKLKQFGELPPDADLARVKIAEMEAELEKLEAQFNDKIHGIHTAGSSG